MATENAPDGQPAICREKLLAYRCGCVPDQEKEEIRRAVEADPRLAACCKEEESLDQCIERNCKKEAATPDLKSRIQACLTESARTATATASAPAKSAPFQPPAPHASVRRPAYGALWVGVAAMVLVATGIVWYTAATQPPPTVVVQESNGSAAHDANNMLDQLVSNFESHPAVAMPAQPQIFNIVNPVGLSRTPQSPAMAKLICVRGEAEPVMHREMVKVCYECPGHQVWNLSVMKICPQVRAALQQHPATESVKTHRTYYLCGDKTGQRPCGVFWEQDGKVMVLVAATPSEHLIEMADTIDL